MRCLCFWVLVAVCFCLVRLAVLTSSLGCTIVFSFQVTSGSGCLLLPLLSFRCSTHFCSKRLSFSLRTYAHARMFFCLSFSCVSYVLTANRVGSGTVGVESLSWCWIL